MGVDTCLFLYKSSIAEIKLDPSDFVMREPHINWTEGCETAILSITSLMNGASYWSTLDAASAYWAVPLRESDKEKTAFSVKRGKYEFNVMTYGLCNAGATYQRLMDMCMSGLPADRILR